MGHGREERALEIVLAERDKQRGGFMLADRAGKISKSRASAILRAADDDTEEMQPGNPNARRANGQGAQWHGRKMSQRRGPEPDDQDDEEDTEDLEDDDSEDMDESDDELDDMDSNDVIDDETDELGNASSGMVDRFPTSDDGKAGLNRRLPPAKRTGKGGPGQTGSVVGRSGRGNVDGALAKCAEYVARHDFKTSLSELRSRIRYGTFDERQKAQDRLQEVYLRASRAIGYKGR